MAFSFDNLPFVLSLVISVLIVVTHVLSAIFGGRLSFTITVFGILLHLLLVAALLLCGAELNILFLWLVSSVAVYTAAHYAVSRISMRKSTETDGEDAA